MADVPCELWYTLNRRQRLLPHLLGWGLMAPVILLVFAAFLQAAFTVWWAGWLALIWAIVFRNFFRGVVYNLVYPTVWMDIRIEEKGIGFIAGGERWWLFLDGLVCVDQLAVGVWTVLHVNGSVIHIPAQVITTEQLAHLRAAVERNRIAAEVTRTRVNITSNV